MQQQSTCYHLQTMQEDFTAFISADYMMSKNLPYWGDSAQPGKSYYMMKLVCDVFGIVDHSTDSNYTYICDELAAGSKSSDHTLTFLNHFVETHIEKWVTQLCLCLDNARICKNQYLIGWAMEMLTKKRFTSIRFIYLTVGHTKFSPDRLFASIGKTFYKSDVFCVQQLKQIAEQYSTSYILTSPHLMQWKASLEQKYSSVPGINNMHDIVISYSSRKPLIKHKHTCFDGEYEQLSSSSYDIDMTLPVPASYQERGITLSHEKFKQLKEQYIKYVKTDTPGYVPPTYLQSTTLTQKPQQSIQKGNERNRRHCTHKGCDGSGNVNVNRSRHYSITYCPLAKKTKHNI